MEAEFADQLNEFLDFMLMEKGASPHTVLAYRNDLTSAATFLASVGRAGWAEADAQDLLDLETFWGSSGAGSTRQRRMAAVRSFFKHLKHTESGPAFPLDSGAKAMRLWKLPKSLTKVQVMKLLDTIPSSTISQIRNRASLELLYGCGLRVSEMTGLSVADYSRESSVVRILGKRGKTRLVPLPDGTEVWLQRYMETSRPALAARSSGRRTDCMILSDHGRPMLRQNILKLVASAAKAAGIEGPVSPHTLRHSYAVHLLEGGADLRVVQELLGHESLETTQIYTELNLDETNARYEASHPRA